MAQPEPVTVAAKTRRTEERTIWRRRGSLLVAFGIGALVILLGFASASQSLEARPGFSGQFTGNQFVAGTCVYCPLASPPPSWSFGAGSLVVIGWNETSGYAISASVGQSGQATMACPQGDQPSGECAFLANGGTYTLYFHAPIPATEGGYLANYTVSYFGPGPASQVPWPGF